MRRLRWISVLALCLTSLCVAACADDGGDPAALSAEEADVACAGAADGLTELGTARAVLDIPRATSATQQLASVADTVTGTEVEAEFDALADATQAFVEALADGTSRSEFAPVQLESHRATAEVGLWCIEHVSVDLVDDMAWGFAAAN